MNRKGFTLVECLISLVIVTVVLVAGMGFYYYSKSLLESAIFRKIAVEVADSKMEEIRNNGYAGLPAGPLEVSLGKISGQEYIYVNDVSGTTDYKEVSVEVTWQEPGKAVLQNIALSTYIAK